jgi:hypothetical protein
VLRGPDVLKSAETKQTICIQINIPYKLIILLDTRNRRPWNRTFHIYTIVLRSSLFYNTKWYGHPKSTSNLTLLNIIKW